MRHRILQTGILEGEPFDASLALALDTAWRFDIGKADAGRMAARMAAIVNGGWREALRAEGASGSEIDGFAAAFQHDAVEQTLALK